MEQQDIIMERNAERKERLLKESGMIQPFPDYNKSYLKIRQH